MPTYTLQCEECGKVREVVRRIAERNDAELCREDDCRGISVRVQETKAPGASFKGTGWTPKSGGGRIQ